MRNTTAKDLKREVFDALYGADKFDKSTAKEVKTLMATPDFKAMYRRKKKNYLEERRYA